MVVRYPTRRLRLQKQGSSSSHHHPSSSNSLPKWPPKEIPKPTIYQYPQIAVQQNTHDEKRDCNNSTTTYQKNVEEEENGSSTWNVLINDGVEKSRKGQNNEALESFQAALREQRKFSGKQVNDDDHIANTLANIGSIYLKQGRLFLAAEALEEALSMKKKVRDFQVDEEGRNRIQLVNVLNNLGNVAFLRDDYSLSLKYYKESAEEAKKIMATTSPPGNEDEGQLANVLYNMGRLYVLKGEWDAAIAILNDALTVPSNMILYHKSSDLLADTMELMGFAYFSTGDLDNALIYFSEALSLCQSSDNHNHSNSNHETSTAGDATRAKGRVAAENPRAAISLVHVAMVMEKRGQTKQAWRAYTAARDIFVKFNLDGDHPCYRAARRSIALLEKNVELTPTSNHQLPTRDTATIGVGGRISHQQQQHYNNFISFEDDDRSEEEASTSNHTPNVVPKPFRFHIPERREGEAGQMFRC